VLLPVQEHLLIPSDRGSTGLKGVVPNTGGSQAKCSTALCRHNHLDTFGTPEKAGQAYLQHWQTNHPKELEKERQRAAALLDQVPGHLLTRLHGQEVDWVQLCVSKQYTVPG
jgi:hypothetical protein